ncbi:MAG TPA: hypothetical protein VFZ78_02670 [Flavisolibacter sp.]
MKKVFCLVVTAAIIVIGCSKSNDPVGTGLDCSTPKSFANDVNPIIQSSCALTGCHASGSNNGPGALTTYQQVFDHRTSIRNAVASGAMPKNGSLTTAQKNAVLCWIDSGAPNN